MQSFLGLTRKWCLYNLTTPQAIFQLCTNYQQNTIISPFSTEFEFDRRIIRQEKISGSLVSVKRCRDDRAITSKLSDISRYKSISHCDKEECVHLDRRIWKTVCATAPAGNKSQTIYKTIQNRRVLMIKTQNACTIEWFTWVASYPIKLGTSLAYNVGRIESVKGASCISIEKKVKSYQLNHLRSIFSMGFTDGCVRLMQTQ